MPGNQKSFDQFRADEGDCRGYAQAVIGGPNAGQPAADAAASNAVAGAALGAAAGAILGSVTGHAGNGAAIGAGTGLLFGSAAGGNSAGYSSYTLQRRYDVAYMQCMLPGRDSRPGGVPRRFTASAGVGPVPPNVVDSAEQLVGELSGAEHSAAELPAAELSAAELPTAELPAAELGFNCRRAVFNRPCHSPGPRRRDGETSGADSLPVYARRCPCSRVA